MNNDYNSYIGKTYHQWTIQRVYTEQYVWKKRNKKITIVYCDATCSRCLKTLHKRRLYDVVGGRSKVCRQCSHPKHRPPLLYGAANSSWKGAGPIPGSYLSSVQVNARVRNIPFDVTMDDLLEQWDLQKGKCALSGLGLNFPTKNGRMSLKSRYCETERFQFASLDRINNKDGYVAGNIQWICLGLNLAKGAWSQDVFISACKAVAKHCDGK